MNYTQIILKPVITEKATFIKEGHNQVTFMVAPRAGKLEIRRAVEEAFKVKVLDVNVVTRKARARKRQGRVVGRESGWKKAYVTLAAGEKIEFFEGV